MGTEWTDELKQEVIGEYKAAEPTPETSMDIVTELAEKYDKTPNGVRMILTRAGVYIKKTPAKGDSSSKSGETKGTRVSKEDALAGLTAAIEAAGMEPDEDVIKRLTGKAAQYFTEVVTKLNG
jgi:hypothetical protein